MAREPAHRSEHTGNPALDRVQNNVRDLMAYVRTLEARIAALELAFGSGAERIALSDANRTLTVAETTGAWLRFSGSLSAGRTITWPLQATDDTTQIRWITNVSGQTLTFQTPHGSTTVANSTTKALVFGNTGPSTLT